MFTNRLSILDYGNGIPYEDTSKYIEGDTYFDITNNEYYIFYIYYPPTFPSDPSYAVWQSLSAWQTPQPPPVFSLSSLISNYLVQPTLTNSSWNGRTIQKVIGFKADDSLFPPQRSYSLGSNNVGIRFNLLQLWRELNNTSYPDATELHMYNITTGGKGGSGAWGAGGGYSTWNGGGNTSYYPGAGGGGGASGIVSYKKYTMSQLASYDFSINGKLVDTNYATSRREMMRVLISPKDEFSNNYYDFSNGFPNNGSNGRTPYTWTTHEDDDSGSWSVSISSSYPVNGGDGGDGFALDLSLGSRGGQGGWGSYAVFGPNTSHVYLPDNGVSNTTGGGWGALGGTPVFGRGGDYIYIKDVSSCHNHNAVIAGNSTADISSTLPYNISTNRIGEGGCLSFNSYWAYNIAYTNSQRNLFETDLYNICTGSKGNPTSTQSFGGTNYVWWARPGGLGGDFDFSNIQQPDLLRFVLDNNNDNKMKYDNILTMTKGGRGGTGAGGASHSDQLPLTTTYPIIFIFITPPS